MMLDPVDMHSKVQVVTRRRDDPRTTFSLGDFTPRSYADNLACDVPDLAASCACVRPRARRARSKQIGPIHPPTIYPIGRI
jgi:hypothetical protein